MTKRGVSFPCKLFITILLFCLSASTALAEANFSVAPGVVHFDLTRPRTQSFLITNVGDERIRLLIKPIYFAVNSKSLNAGEPLEITDGFQDNLSKFTLVSPRILSLKPGDRRKVRVSIRPRRNLIPGDYRSHLLISAIGRKQIARGGNSGSGGLKINLTVRMETAVAVYGRVGIPKFDLRWECNKSKDNQLLLRVRNGSNWRFSGWFTLFEFQKGSPKPLLTARLVSLGQTNKTIPLKIVPEKKLEIRWGETKEKLDSGLTRCELDG